MKPSIMLCTGLSAFLMLANTPSVEANAKYKNHQSVVNACTQQWNTHHSDTNLSTCRPQTTINGSYVILGNCSSAKKNGLRTQEDGKCQLTLQLQCKRHDQSWNDTQASCTTLLHNPSKFTNDDGTLKEE